MSGLGRDFHHAVRSLLKSPAFTIIAVLSLALGIGANTAIFTIFDQVILRLLPVEDPRSLVQIVTRGPHVGNNNGFSTLSFPMYKDYRDRNEVFDGVLCRRGEVVNMGYGESTERVEAEIVSGNYFQVLGVKAALGRVFSAADETAPGANPVVVLNHDFWRNRFSGDPSILGQTIRINDHPMTVVGVSAPGFAGINFGYRPDLHVPVTMKRQVTPTWDDLDNRRSRWAQVFARLQPEVGREQAEASIRILYNQIIQDEVQEAYFSNVSAFAREQFLGTYPEVLPGGQGFSRLRSSMEQPMVLLMALVGMVLLIACANVSNLLVARGSARRREISIRLALGAGRKRIIRQVLVESLLLAIAGGLLGILLAIWVAKSLLLYAPNDQIELFLSPTPDFRILLFTLSIAAFSALLFGLVPALQVSRTDIAGSLKEQATSIAGGQIRLRKALVVLQIGLSFLLLLGSGLFVQSLWNLRAADTGFQATNVIRFKLNPPLSNYDTERSLQFYQRLQENLDALPGVKSTGLAVVPILEDFEWDTTITVEGYQAKDGENMNPFFNSVSPGYFDTLGMSWKAGQDFNDQIGIRNRKAAVVNESFAKHYFGDRSPIGYRFGLGNSMTAELDIEIVGVVADTRYENLRDEFPRQIFICYRQSSWASEMTAYVRTSLPSDQMFAAVRREVRGMDPNIPLFDMNTMGNQLDRSLAIERLVAYLSSAFGVLATVLALVGLYGVTSYSVTRRSREIGIRMALGAKSLNVVRMVLNEVLILAAVGIGIGLPASWWLAQFVRSQLYEVQPRDLGTFALAACGLILVAVLAGTLPARRASRIHPVRVMRYE